MGTKVLLPHPMEKGGREFQLCKAPPPTKKKKKTVQVHMPVHTVLSSHMKGGRKENG